MFQYRVLCLLIVSACTVFAQKPTRPDATVLYHQIQKLNFLGSVLYIAAHPDDENTRMISYMANHHKARTGYLSLTRGDGGQNLIGPELRELLGVIRTQELIEARKIDGGEQFFTRANDFGFSKVPEETLKIWNKEEVLEDMIYIIRKFKPDIIINRFDHRSPGTTHGHHTSSAMLSVELFDKANDPKIFPKQLEYVSPWQPKRIFFNTSWWFFGGKDKFDKADKSHLIPITTGVYYPLFGISNQEIAALSRSRHQSQGFGTMGARGEEIEYLELLKGTSPQNPQNLFDGIDTSWNRVKGGQNVAKILKEVENEFNFTNPSKSIPKLIKAYHLIQKLEDKHWKSIKSKEIIEIIAGCAGLFLEAVAEENSITPGDTLKLKIETINRSPYPIELQQITETTTGSVKSLGKPLKNNVTTYTEWDIRLPETIGYTTPYWLKEAGTNGMYIVTNQEYIGIPDIIRPIKIKFEIKIDNTPLTFEREVIHKYNDPVKGEVYKPLDIVPEVSVSMPEKVQVFKGRETRKVAVHIRAGKDDVAGDVSLNLPEEWRVSPDKIPFRIRRKGSTTTLYFTVTAPEKPSETTGTALAVVNEKIYTKEQVNIDYEHITPQQVLTPSETRFLHLDIQTTSEKIAYIMGAGDEVPVYLSQLGYDVTLLTPQEITSGNLEAYNVVILGIRAFNTVEALAYKQEILFDFVKKGHTMIVQYNTAGGLVTKDIAPYPLQISRDRVTEEDAEVRFLAPQHPVLNSPNAISKKDFEGWVQEQGLYYPDEWDKAFIPVLSANDTGESPKDGGLLIAPYGKGYYIYTGLSFFRELPAGVSGAYRLLANMIALKQNDSSTHHEH